MKRYSLGHLESFNSLLEMPAMRPGRAGAQLTKCRFNSLLEMRAGGSPPETLLLSFSFQFSIGDAVARRWAATPPTPFLFQFSIGDAAGQGRLCRLGGEETCFNSLLEMHCYAAIGSARRTCSVSILYWRCRDRLHRRDRREGAGFNSLLEMPDWSSYAVPLGEGDLFQFSIGDASRC